MKKASPSTATFIVIAAAVGGTWLTPLKGIQNDISGMRTELKEMRGELREDISEIRVSLEILSRDAISDQVREVLNSYDLSNLSADDRRELDAKLEQIIAQNRTFTSD